MSDPIVSAQQLNIQQIRQLKPGATPAAGQAQTKANKLDEIWFEHKGQTYLAVGEQLKFQSLQGKATLQLQLEGLKDPIEVKLLHQNDEINTWQEGWNKGTSWSDSLSKAWSGAVARQDWAGLTQISQGVGNEHFAPAPPPPTNTNPPVLPPTPSPVDPAPPTDPQPEETPIEVFFTQPGMQADEDAQVNNPDYQLAKLLDTAQTSVDIAAFEIDSERVADAILRAKARNIPVRIVTDTDYMHEPQLQRLIQAGIPVIDDQRSGLMHNKFVVVDQKTVWTGSFNLTENCAWKNNNNAIKIQSKDLAVNFTREFEEMFVDRQFGKSSPNDMAFPSVTVGKATIESYFAAEGGVAGKVEEALNKAQHSIKFMAFSFTHDGIGAVVAKKFKDEQVQVQGVFEKTGSGTQHSEYGAMKQQGLDVKVDGNKNVMHHKVFIVDDKTVITGSFNFSDSADQKNDENLLIIEDPAVAKRYNEEFKRVYQQGQ